MPYFFYSETAGTNASGAVEKESQARSAAGWTVCRIKAPGTFELWVVVVVVVRRGGWGKKKPITPTARCNKCTEACLEARLRLGLDRKTRVLMYIECILVQIRKKKIPQEFFKRFIKAVLPGTLFLSLSL